MNLKKIQNICFAIITACVVLILCIGTAAIWGLMDNSIIAGKLYSTFALILFAAYCVMRIARKLDLNDNQIIRFIQD
jgi:hypothetical protein